MSLPFTKFSRLIVHKIAVKIIRLLEKFTNTNAERAVRERAIQAMRISEARLRGIFDSAFDAIVAMNSSGVITDWNPRAEAIFGYRRDQVIGQELSSVIFPADFRETHGDEIEGFYQQKNGKSDLKALEILAVRKNGELFPIQFSVSPLQMEDTFMYTAFIADITERTKKEREIFETNKALKAATKAKSDFLANMSHEIRTPINGVLGMLMLLLDTPLQETQKHYAETARASADMLLSLINDILDLSKAEAGKMRIEIVDFDLEQVFSDIEHTLFFAAKTKGLRLLKIIPPDLQTHFKGDPTRLRQILLNLVNNAIKFTETGSVTIIVKVESQDGDRLKIRFEVKDTGIGIAAEALDRMFLPFSQADSSTTRRFGGTGLGLSISKHLVNLMGGEIGVSSLENQGSTFWFTLDLEQGESRILEETNSGEQSLSNADGFHLKILVAEDNLVNQVIARKVLEKMGHTVVIVANGNEALDALRANNYDLILMDCQMPQLDGYETTRIIRTSRSLSCNEIPIIAMTANAMLGDREKCLSTGMNDYLSKPMKPQDLEEVIYPTLHRTGRFKNAAA